MKEIKLNKGYSTLVSDKDYPKLIKFKWRIHKEHNRIYVWRNSSWRMHWDIVGKPSKGMVVDHINMANAGLKKTNTSGYTGVSWDKSKERWAVIVTINRKHKNIGRFKDKKLAVEVFDRFKIKHYGKNCFLNFPEKYDWYLKTNKQFWRDLKRRVVLKKTNTSGYRGVSWCKREKRYIASIGWKKKIIFLGQRKDPKEASELYEKKRLELYGEV